jgi:hypothetical protein
MSQPIYDHPTLEPFLISLDEREFPRELLRRPMELWWSGRYLKHEVKKDQGASKLGKDNKFGVNCKVRFER